MANDPAVNIDPAMAIRLIPHTLTKAEVIGPTRKKLIMKFLPKIHHFSGNIYWIISLSKNRKL